MKKDMKPNMKTNMKTDMTTNMITSMDLLKNFGLINPSMTKFLL